MAAIGLAVVMVNRRHGGSHPLLSRPPHPVGAGHARDLSRPLRGHVHSSDCRPGSPAAGMARSCKGGAPVSNSYDQKKQ